MEASALQKSMEKAMSKCMKESEGEQTTRKKQKKAVDWFVFLPDDILLDILKRVPDAFLRFKAKFVCRRWFNIIANRILLDHASYILQKMMITFTTRLVDIREEGQVVQVKEQYLDIPHIGMIIRSWCNEFLLISHYKEKKKSLYVYNLISKEGSYLPECDASCGGHYSIGKCGVALSFDGFKGIYKVVHLFISRTIECHILTLKTDISTCASSKWKKIEVPYMNAGQHIKRNPVSVQGRFMNWRIYHSNDLVSVDMAKEEICIIRLPGSSNRSEYFCYLFVMDGFLALFNSGKKAEIWVLKDFRKAKWENLLSISDSNTHFEVFYRYPRNVVRYRICSRISKRYIILKSIDGMYSYDLKYGVMKKLDIHIESNEHCVVHSAAPSLILYAKNRK